MKGKPLILVLLAGAALWYLSRRAKSGVGLGADGKPVEIGRVGSDITTNDTRGDAIAKGMAALLGDPYSQGTLTYADDEIDVSFTKGMDVSGMIYGPRLDHTPSRWSTREGRLQQHYLALRDSPDPAARREAWLFSWSTLGSDLEMWWDNMVLALT